MKMKKLLFLIAGLLGMISGFAQNFEYTYQGKTLNYTITSEENRTASVARTPYAYEEVIIPDTVCYLGETYMVTSIAYEAFLHCDKITSVVIPHTVTSIEARAFTYCRGLSSITIPDSVISIGDRAFSGCSGIKSIKLGKSVSSIGELAFDGCSGVSTITIPESVTSIGSSAFDNLQEVNFASVESMCRINYVNYACNPLYKAHDLKINGELITELVIPSTVETIGDYAFSGCTSLQSVYISDSVTSIGTEAFLECFNLTTVHIPDSVTTIGNGAFRWCKNLISVIIPNSVTLIDGFAFYMCERLKSVTLGNSITIIGEYAFGSCFDLTSITIPSSVRTIKFCAFSYCARFGKGLTTVQIGSGIESIEREVFKGCTTLTDIYITAQTPPEMGEDVFYGVYGSKLWLQDPGDNTVIDSYTSTNGWSRFKSYSMTVAESVVINKPEDIEEDAEKIQLYASVSPEDVALPYVFWNTSDPEVATVDCNGLVTLKPLKDSVTRSANVRTCKITASTLYANGPIAEVSVPDINTGIEDMASYDSDSDDEIIYSKPYRVYSLNGCNLGQCVENLESGIYIVRQDSKVRKIAIK